MPLVTKTDNFFRAASVLLIVAYLFSVKNFLTGNKLIFHDNLPYLSDLILSQSGSKFWLPKLRSFHQTQAISTWQAAELRIGFDPVAIGFFRLLSYFRINILLATAWYLTAFFLFFVLTVTLIGKFLGLKNFSLFFLLLMLLLSPNAQSMWGQAPGFLMPFRYVPITIFFFLKWFKSWKTRDILLGSLFFGLTLQGYQAGYACFVLAVTFAVFFSKIPGNNLVAFCRRHYLVLFACLCWITAASIPLIVAFLEVNSKFFALPREYMPYSYDMDFPRIYRSSYWKDGLWHGSLWAGFTCFFLVALSGALLALKALKNLPSVGQVLSDFEIWWRVALIAAVFLGFSVVGTDRLTVFSPGEYFFGLRNWGFLSSMFTTASVLLGAISLNFFLTSREKIDLHKLSNALIVLFFVAFVSLDVFVFKSSDVETRSQENANPALVKTEFLTSSLRSRQINQALQREFLFDPVIFFPIVHEGAAIWDSASHNFHRVFSDYKGWPQLPSTTVTHSFEYLDYYESRNVKVYNDEKLWRNSKFSKLFYVSNSPMCVNEGAYKNVSQNEKHLSKFDLIKVGMDIPKFCNGAKYPIIPGDKLTVVQRSDEVKEVEYTSEYGMIVVFNENYDNHLKIDGEKTKIYSIMPANWRSSAVFLPPGSGTITVSYRPTLFILVSYLRFFFFLAMLCFVARYSVSDFRGIIVKCQTAA